MPNPDATKYLLSDEQIQAVINRGQSWMSIYGGMMRDLADAASAHAAREARREIVEQALWKLTQMSPAGMEGTSVILHRGRDVSNMLTGLRGAAHAQPAARSDGERLDWLEKKPHGVWWSSGGGHWYVNGQHPVNLAGHTRVRECIDEAMDTDEAAKPKVVRVCEFEERTDLDGNKFREYKGHVADIPADVVEKYWKGGK